MGGWVGTGTGTGAGLPDPDGTSPKFTTACDDRAAVCQISIRMGVGQMNVHEVSVPGSAGF